MLSNNFLTNDAEDQESREFQEYSEENRRFLAEQEIEFKRDLVTARFVQNFLNNLFCNSCNIFVTLVCLDLGLNLMISVMGGFSVGSFSGFKDLYESAESINERRVDGKLVRGIFKLILAGFVSYQTAGEMANIEAMAQKAAEFYQQDLNKYEIVQKEKDNSWLMLALYFGGSLAFGSMVMSAFRK